jgi:D-tyrosyl-tRNA(Tyr) deacylase
MIGLIQRVTSAAVSVDETLIGEIGAGLLALVAVEPEDSAQSAARLAERIVSYRVFSDADGRMNESLLQQGLALLVIPQFTLAADTRKGTRPSFTGAAPSDQGRRLFESFVQSSRQYTDRVKTGQFGAHMRVSLVNDGPVTFWLHS